MKAPIDNPNFLKWFEGSKVVDQAGKPLVLFHGTFASFTRFDHAKSFDGSFHFGTAQAANERNDYWLDGADLSVAQPNVMPVLLCIKNPKRLTYDPFDEGEWANEIHLAVTEGFDGIVYRNVAEDKGSESWCAFYPHQIKSAMGNSGRFVPGAEDITDSEDAEEEHEDESVRRRERECA